MSEIAFGLLLGPIVFLVSVVMFRMTSGRDGSGERWQGYVDPVLFIPGVVMLLFLAVPMWTNEPAGRSADTGFRFGLFAGFVACTSLYLSFMFRRGPTPLTAGFAAVSVATAVSAFVRLVV